MINHEKLINAILFQAITDYFMASLTDDSDTKRECMRFFKSEWYEDLTQIKSAQIINNLNQRIKLTKNAIQLLEKERLKYKVVAKTRSIAVRVGKERYIWTADKNINEFLKEIKK